VPAPLRAVGHLESSGHPLRPTLSPEDFILSLFYDWAQIAQEKSDVDT
jgi:hypothetical protein